MRRLSLNLCMALAMAVGGLTAAQPAFAEVYIEDEQNCGACDCQPGQECESTQTGCKCTYPDGA